MLLGQSAQHAPVRRSHAARCRPATSRARRHGARVSSFPSLRAVTKVLHGRDREENKAFREFCGSLALAIEFAAPAAGNEKGGVGGSCGFVEDISFGRFPNAIA